MLIDISTILLALPLLSLAARPKNAIQLSQVQSLTLKGNGAKTTHRRVPAIPQLRCVSSSSICRLHTVDVMRCTNQGSSYDGEDVEWSCAASLPESLKLGSTEVICEGYASPDDPFVLKGSCGVEYRLALTGKGEARHPDVANGGAWFSDDEGGTDWSAWIFAVIFVGVAGWIVYSACYGNADPRQPRRGGRYFGGGGGGGANDGGGGGGGGGGWNPGWGGGGDEPPPPYYPGTKPSSTQQQQQGWTPGFWSGLAGGAAAGYMAGGRRNRNEDDYTRRGSGSGWGSGAGPSRQAPSSSGSSSARNESTGFGSTSRR